MQSRIFSLFCILHHVCRKYNQGIMILVTGTTGFLGSAVLRKLIEAGEPVRVLVRHSSNRLNLKGLAIEIIEGDLLDKDSIEKALRGCKGLFHVAADYRIWVPKPESMFNVNVFGTRQLMELALEAGIEKVIYTSSVAVLGNESNAAPGHEETPVSFTDMVGPYKQSKFRAEEAVRELISLKGLPAVIVNPSTPIGPRDIKPTPTGRIIVEAALGQIPAYVDTGLNIAHVDDIAEGHLLAYKKGKIGERYILGGENMTLKQILNEVATIMQQTAPKICIPHIALLPIAYIVDYWARYMGSEEPFITVDGLKMSRKKMFFSSSKAICDLDYKYRSSKEAITDAIGWFKKNGYLKKK